MNDKQIPEEYRPLGMWAYFGYTLLFSVPVVGFICILVFALGGAKNINLRNFARSYFCWFIIMLIAVAIVFALGGFSVLLSNLGFASLIFPGA